MYRPVLGSLLALVLLSAAAHAAAAGAEVDSFSPQGTVKGVRQVAARFSEPTVPFGDPRLGEPFAIDCPEAGKGRWADTRNFVYDFERDTRQRRFRGPDVRSIRRLGLTRRSKGRRTKRGAPQLFRCAAIGSVNH